jgi:hypothetical protein
MVHTGTVEGSSQVHDSTSMEEISPLGVVLVVAVTDLGF